jgi:hypothetical protein
MMEALVEARASADEIAQLAQRQARKKIPQIQAAIEGHRMTDPQRILIRFSMAHLAFLEGQISQLDEQIFGHIERCGLGTWQKWVRIWTCSGQKRVAVPGLAYARQQRKRRQTGAPLYCAVTRGDGPLSSSVHGVPRTEISQHFRPDYQRLAPRIGHKRAIVAVAHGLLLTVFEILRTHEPYSGLGADRMPPEKTKRLIRHHSKRIIGLYRWLTRTSTSGT